MQPVWNLPSWIVVLCAACWGLLLRCWGLEAFLSCCTENPTKLGLWVVEIEEVPGTSWQKDIYPGY